MFGGGEDRSEDVVADPFAAGCPLQDLGRIISQGRHRPAAARPFRRAVADLAEQIEGSTGLRPGLAGMFVRRACRRRIAFGIALLELTEDKACPCVGVGGLVGLRIETTGLQAVIDAESDTARIRGDFEFLAGFKAPVEAVKGLHQTGRQRRCGFWHAALTYDAMIYIAKGLSGRRDLIVMTGEPLAHRAQSGATKRPDPVKHRRPASCQ
jgi:hypothetical protein